MRGVQFTVAISLIAEIGDLSRFDHPRQLMAWLGATPSEHSSGGSRRLGGITKAGNSRARRMLVEAAWSYRHPAKVSRIIQVRQEGLPQPIIDRAWDAQLRLCGRYRRMGAPRQGAGCAEASIPLISWEYRPSPEVGAARFRAQPSKALRDSSAIADSRP